MYEIGATFLPGQLYEKCKGGVRIVEANMMIDISCGEFCGQEHWCCLAEPRRPRRQAQSTKNKKEQGISLCGKHRVAWPSFSPFGSYKNYQSLVRQQLLQIQAHIHW